jgi:hypothetical protein
LNTLCTSGSRRYTVAKIHLTKRQPRYAVTDEGSLLTMAA